MLTIFFHKTNYFIIKRTNEKQIILKMLYFSRSRNKISHYFFKIHENNYKYKLKHEQKI